MTDAVNYERLFARVEGLVQTQADLAQRLDRLASTLEDRYTSREVYQTHRAADRDDVADLRSRLDQAEERRAADRRLIIFSLAVPFLLIVFQVYANSRGLSSG